MNTEAANVLIALAILIPAMFFLYRYAMSAEHRARWDDKLPHTGKDYRNR